MPQTCPACRISGQKRRGARDLIKKLQGRVREGSAPVITGTIPNRIKENETFIVVNFGICSKINKKNIGAISGSAWNQPQVIQLSISYSFFLAKDLGKAQLRLRLHRW
jgi:hypothetical protein